MPVDVGFNPSYGPEEQLLNPVRHQFWGRDDKTYTISGKTHADVAIQASIAGLRQKEAVNEDMKGRLTPNGDVLILSSDTKSLNDLDEIVLNYHGGPIEASKYEQPGGRTGEESPDTYLILKEEIENLERVDSFEAGSELLEELDPQRGEAVIFGGLLVVLPKDSVTYNLF